MAKAVEATKAGVPAVDEDMHPVVRAIMESPFYESEEVDALALASRLLVAESPEELLNINTEGDVTHAEDVLGKPFMLHGVRFNPSTVEGGNQDFPLYAIMDVTWNGEKDVMSCGGLNVCVAAFTLADNGWLPRMVKITKRSKPTRGGFYPLNLVDAGADENQGTLSEEPF